jgi:predicted metalloprotease
MYTSRTALLAVPAVLALMAGCGSDSKSDKSASTSTPKPAAQGITTRAPASSGAAGATKPATGLALRALSARRANALRRPNIAGVADKPLPQQVQLLASDVGAFWQEAFNRKQVRFRPLTIAVVEPGGAGPGQCTDVTHPYLCGDAMVLPTAWFAENAEPIGDFAVAFPIAYLWGQDILRQIGQSGAKPTAADTLTASCLAGIWSASVYQRKLLQPGDIAEAAKLVATTAGSPQAAKAMAQAFDTGFGSGQGGDCTKFRR